MDAIAISARYFLFFCIVCASTGFAHAQVHPISESYSISGETLLLDIQPDAGIQLYRSKSQLATDDVTVEDGTLGEVYLVSLDGGEPVHLTGNKALFDGNYYDAWFTANGESVLIANATANRFGYRTNSFYLYNVATEEFDLIDAGDNVIHPSFRIDKADEGRVFYFYNTDYQLFKFDVASLSVSAITFPGNADASWCTAFSVARDIDKLAFSDCQDTVFLKTGEEDWIQLQNDNVSRIGNPTLSGNGEILAYSIDRRDLFTLDLSSENAVPEHRYEDERGFLSLRDINHDGSKLFFYTLVITDFEFRQASVDHNTVTSFLFDINAGKGASVGLFNAHLTGASFINHGFYDDQFVFSSGHSSVGNIAYSVELDGFLDIPQEAVASNVSISSDSPLTAELRLTNTNSPSLFYRTNTYTLEQRKFALSLSEFSDNWGLDALNYEYQYLACNVFYVCEDEPRFVETVDIMDFAAPPAIAVSYSSEGFPEYEAGRVTVSTTDTEEDAIVRLRRFTSSSSSPSEQWTHKPKSHELYQSQYCIRNNYGYTGCGSFSQPTIVPAPISGTTVAFKLLGDLSGVRVHWYQNNSTEFKLFRIIGDDTALIYEGNDTVFVDSDMLSLPGREVKYRVLACNDVGCAHSDSSTRKIELADTPLSISVDAEGAQVYGVPLKISTSYFFESLEIQRIDTLNKTQETVATLSGDNSNYLDRVPTASEEWLYQLKGCYNDSCHYSDVLTVSHHRLSFQAPILPEAPTNLRFNNARWYMAGDISWDTVAGVDGYRVTVKIIQGAGRLSEKRWTVDADTTNIPYFYEENFGKAVKVSVQSYILEENSRSVEHLSVATEIEVQLVHPDILPQELASHDFRTYHHYHNGKNTLNINVTKHLPFDRYFVHSRTSPDDDYSRLPMTRSSYSQEYVVESDEPQNIEFKVSGCNDYLDKCVWLNGDVTFILQPDIDLSGITSAPDVRVGEQGQLLISPTYAGNLEFQHMIVEASHRGRRFREVYDGPYLDAFDYRSTDFSSSNRDFAFRTKLCLVSSTETQSRGFHCTEFSDAAEFQLPDDFIIIPNDATSFSTELVTDPEGNYQIQLNSQYWPSNSADPAYPHFIRIFKGIDDGALEPFIELDYPVTNEDLPSGAVHVDNEVTGGTLYRYQVQYCTEAGCGGLSDARSAAVPEDYMPVTPDIPEFRLYQENAPTVNYQFVFEVEQLVDFIDVKWGDRGADDLYRESGVSLKGYLERAGLLRITRLERTEDIWISARACNGDVCSEWSEVKYFAGEGITDNELAMSGSDFENINNGIWSGQPYWVQARYGRFNTYRGQLNYNRLVHVGPGSEFSNTVYLAPDTQHNCATLFSQGLKLQEGEPRRSEHVSQLVEIIYTGNGCAGNSELELFSYYIDSDYFSAPVLISDPELLRNRWLDVTLNFDSENRFTVQVDQQDALTFSSDISLPGDVFKLSFIEWNLRSLSALSSLSVISDELTDDINTSLSPWTDFSSIDTFSPEAFVFLDSQYLTQVFNINVWALSEQGIVFKQQLSFDGDNSNAWVIDGFAPGESPTVFFNRCDGEQCGPFYASKIQLPKYRTLNSWPDLVRDSQTEVQRLNLRLPSGRGYPQSVTVNQKAENTDAYTEVLDMPYTEAVRRYSPAENFDGRLLFSALGLDPDNKYQYFATLCNPLGCIDTSVVTFEVPVDSDDDGVVDENDPFPDDPNEWQDTDGDGVGNNADEDDDGDGIPDAIELELGLDPLAFEDALQDFDGDGFNNLAEYLAGSGIDNESLSPIDLGRFYSFEGELGEELDVSGTRFLHSFAWHGSWALGSARRETTMNINIPGKIKPGLAFFAVLDLSDSMSFDLKLDGEEIDTLQPIQVNPNRGYRGWYIYPFLVEQEANELTLNFRFNLYTTRATLQIDGIFLPGAEKQLVKADFDGDGKADLALRDSRNSMNHILNLVNSEQRSTRFGLQAADIPVNGDFDGDGKADIAVRRPSNQMWYVLRSSDGEIGRHHFGRQEEDIPVPADYDGDGITDIAVRRPSNSMWYILRSSDGEIGRHKFGLQAEDIPVPADYDGDGKADIAVRRANNRMWYILRSSDSEIERHKFGLQEADIPIPADYDGDGKADIAVRRANNRMWYIKQSSDAQIQRVKFGLQEQDIPVISDYDGDGKADIAVRRPSTHFWYVLNSSDDSITRNDFGREPEYVPVTAPITIRMNMISAIAAESGQDKAEDNKADTEWDYFQELYEMNKELTGIE